MQLREWLKLKQLTLDKVARDLGYHSNALVNILYGGTPPSHRFFKFLEMYTQMEVKEADLKIEIEQNYQAKMKRYPRDVKSKRKGEEQSED